MFKEVSYYVFSLVVALFKLKKTNLSDNESIRLAKARLKRIRIFCKQITTSERAYAAM